MGGKTNTSTQTTSIPPEVLQNYENVNARANQTASTPFQQYSTDPNAFVAPLTDAQNAGLAATQAAAGQAQPYFNQANDVLNSSYSAAQPYFGQATNYTQNAFTGAQPYLNTATNLTAAGLSGAAPYNTAATQYAQAGAQAVNPQGLNIGEYISPYLQTVAGTTEGLLNQENQQALNGALGNMIGNGSFGGDRAGIVGANLQQQLQLSNANVLSNLLNSGYNTALGTAQQQQGVDLSAAQANRAALQNASTQMLGIGQTQFGQDLSAANENLGIGQQGFQQGMQTGQQMAGLGQTIQGSGASQASGLAGLGTGAQSEALQGAQAEMAAGQQQQQTQQAGLSALYNQFLMQQSYPFQVDQFLANIAEGTGSLSGQTTTTTTPGSLFSDERLKEGKRLVGFTFDKQPIYVYRYKGDSTPHMGLMAQEVEKTHPGAVGDYGGLKTVNYGLATAEAAKRGRYQRGGFAIGGSPSGGFDPQLMEIMLQNAQGMYGPYMTGGPGVAASGSGPYGSTARVPSANVPVAGLRPVNVQTKAPQSGLAAAAQTAGQVDSLASSLEKGANFIKSKMPANDDSASALANDLSNSTDWSDGPNLDSDLPPFRRGGRARFAGGGMPYQGGLALDIPDDPTPYHLPNEPGAPPSSGDSTLGDLAAMAKIAAAFMKRGGLVRHGFADGGVPDDQDWIDPDSDLDAGLVATPDFNSAAKRTIAFEGGASPNPGENEKYGINQAAHPELDVQKLNEDQAVQTLRPYWDAVGADKMSPDMANVAFDTAVNLGIGAAKPLIAQANGDPNKLLDLRQSYYDNLADKNPDKYGQFHQGWTNRVNALRSDFGAPQGVSPAPQSGLAAATPNAPAFTDIAPAPASPGLGSAVAEPQSASSAPQHSGFMDSLKDPSVFIPLLKGIATVGAAPTRNFLVALEQGGGEFANAYQAQREFAVKQAQLAVQQGQLGVSQTQAQTARMRAGAESIAPIEAYLANRYKQVDIDPATKMPIYRDNYTGRTMSAQEYADAANTVMGGLSKLGSAGGPTPLSLIAPPSGTAQAPSAIAPATAAPVPVMPTVTPSQQSAVAKPTPAAPTPAPTTVAAKLAAGTYKQVPQPEPISPDALSGLDPQYNPMALRQQALDMRSYGASVPGAQDKANALESRAADIENGKIVAYNKDGSQFLGFKNQQNTAANAAAENANNAALANETNAKSIKFDTESQSLRQALAALDDSYQKFGTGRPSAHIADLLSAAQTLGIPITDSQKALLGGTDSAEKNAAILTLQNAVGSGIANRAPAAVIGQESKTIAGPDRAPDARFHIAVQQKALLDQMQDYLSAWNTNKANINDIADFTHDWVAENPVSKYENAAVQKTPIYAGMSDAAKKAFARQILPGETEAHYQQRLKNETPGAYAVPSSGPYRGKMRIWGAPNG
jgi:hypothetical protein